MSVGFDRRALLRAATKGELVRVAPGIYVPAADRSPEARHRMEVLAATTTPDVAVSHGSAAVIHGLPMLSPDFRQLNLTSATSDRGYKRAYRHIHPGPLAPCDVEERDGIWVTTLERTAVDVARTSPRGFAGALAVIDAALALGADRATMSSCCGRPRTGVGVARCALRHANSLSDNPGESWGRAQIIEAGLPVPRIQHDVVDARGRFVARPDYDWVDETGRVRIVGEFDGLGKYLKYLRPGEEPVDVIRREKEREGRLQDLGIVVVRWVYADLVADRVVPRLLAQMRATGILHLTSANPT